MNSQLGFATGLSNSIAYAVLLSHLTIGLVCAWMLRKNLAGDLRELALQPRNMCILGIGLVHSAVPIFLLSQSRLRFVDSYNMASVGWSFFAAILMLVVFAIATRSARPAPLPRDNLVRLNQSARIFLIVFLVVPGIIGGYYYYKSVSSIGLSEFMKDRIGYAQSAGGTPRIAFRMLDSVMLVFLADYLLFRRKVSLCWYLVSLLVVGFVNGYTQSRLGVFLAIFNSALVFLACHSKPISIPKVFSLRNIVIFVVAVTGLIFLTRVREQGGDLSRKVDRSVMDTVCHSVNGAFGNHGNVVWLADRTFEYQYGRSYYAGLVVVIPRRFWPDKPVGAGPVFKNMVFPGSYVLGRRGTSSATTGSLTESFMNGGVIGVGIYALFYGLILNWIGRFRQKLNGPLTIALFVYTVSILGFSLSYQEFLGAYSRWLLGAIPLYFACFFFHKGFTPRNLQ